jgi:uncharacterized protein YfaS (alpha-2-macroglobulin family)
MSGGLLMRIRLFVILCLLSLSTLDCGSNTDASTDLKVLENPRDISSSDGGSSMNRETKEYIPQRLFKKEHWENISEPNLPEWGKVKKLMNEQKYEAAYKELEGLLRKFREQKDFERITHTLMKMVQLRMALHGYETAVRFLKSEEWPDGLYSQIVLNLYYAYALINYYNSYNWEINQREKVQTGGEVDLKRFTREDIYNEAQKAYLLVFSNREELSGVKVKSFSSYITPNTYPERIRGTLRDAVSYLYVDMLENTAMWRPDEVNGIFALPLQDMLEDKKVIVDLSDRETHSLLKIVYILDDLRAWHKKNGESEAAFEAFLEKLRILHKNFTNPKDREKIRKALEGELKRVENLEWWSVGMDLLAEFTMAEGMPDSLIKAREITIECQKRFSNSIGARMCLSRQKQIEAPSYVLEGMNLDGNNKRSILITYKNLNRMYFRAYKIDFFSLISTARDYYIFPQYRKLDGIVFDKKPDYEWSESLDTTEDFAMHKKFVTPPVKGNGLYLIAASTRRDFSKSDNVIQAIYILFSSMVLETRSEGDGSMIVRVVDGESGRPIPDVDVALYRYDWTTGHKKYKEIKSDTDGLARFQEGYSSHNYFVVARKGENFTTDLQYNYFYRADYPTYSERTLVYTDRSIYRPLQKIKWKIVHYGGVYGSGNYRVIGDRELEVYLYDYNHQVVEKKVVRTNEFGTASGEFMIPAGRIMGQWSIGTSWGTQGIRVEEYKRPSFEVTLNKPENPLRLNKEAEISGEVRYYFGLPVSAGSVKYIITRQAVPPPWWDYYSFVHRRRGFYNQSQETVSSGLTTLDPNGRFKIRFTPVADERLSEEDKKHIVYEYRVNVDVTDEGGETRSASLSYRVGFSSVEARILSDYRFFVAGQNDSSFKIIRQGLNGEPKAGKGRYRIVSLKDLERPLMPSDMPEDISDGNDRSYEKYRKTDDRLRARWENDYKIEKYLMTLKEDRGIKAGDITHDEKGESYVVISDLRAGLYKLYYETVDEFGARYETSKTFIVADSKTRFNLPLLFIAQKDNYRVGEIARFLIGSGFNDSVIYLYRYRDSKAEKEEILRSKDIPSIYELKISEDLRGGFMMRAGLFNDYRYIFLSESITVPWDNKELKIEFVTFRDTVRPGAKETFKIKVTAPEGVKNLHRMTELLSYMYDKSLDYFTPHHYTDILRLYPFKGVAGNLRTNLYMARHYWVSADGFKPLPVPPALNPDYLKYISGYGIGGVGHRVFRRTATLGAVQKEEAAPLVFAKKSAPSPVATRAAEDKDVPGEVEGFGGLGSKGGGKGGVSMEMAAPPRREENETAGVDTSARIELRKDFSETAFFIPHLLLESDNTASIEFQVPDSVTSYNLFVHAITKDLMGGVLNREVKAIKELMVRPYLPRFLREGDEATIKVVVNNASDRDLSGELRFEIFDPQSEKSLLSEFGILKDDTIKAFNIKAKGSTNLTFAIKTPPRIDIVNFRVTARTKEFTDGELRTLPILPGRMHLIQSKSVVLKDKSKKTIRFEDLAKKDDPTLINDQMIVTLDAQLFLTVLQALPYLVNYPYESTEQILNKFLSAGIVSSIYRDHPAISKMAETFSRERDTRFEKWDKPDPNRRMLLEETPWLNIAKGGVEAKEDLINILNPEIANLEREIAISQIRKAQTSIGGFPWFPGGPPSPYITLYILYGFSKAMEFRVDVPRDMIYKAWQYLHQHYITEVWPFAKSHDCCWEFITFLNYVLSNYPDSSYYGGIFTDEERQEMLEFSFRHWKRHSPYLKGYLALTLERMKRHSDAVLVFSSVMDSARYSEEEGTHWAPEDRGWLWYNDSIETHAFAIRTLLEVMPGEKKLDGLVQWILMNKKLNHWKSTKATAEVIYSLVKYMEANKTLGIKEEAKVTIGKDEYRFVFEPDKYTGKNNQIVIPSEKIDPDTTSNIVIEKPTKGFMFASATWHFSTEKLPDAERGDLFNISRTYYRREPTPKGYVLKPLSDGTKLSIGDQIEVHISIRSKHPAEYVHLKDPRPAGCEPESTVSKHKWDLGIYWYEEVRDSAQNFFFESLPQGEYTFRYRLRANMAGTFKVAPATIQSIYAPEFNAYSKGNIITIEDTK